MKRIKLTQGQFALVDTEDYEQLNQYKWCAAWSPKTQSFYVERSSKIKNGKRYLILMAREVLGLKRDDILQSDHINHDTLDNRRVNLRAVTNQQNQWNQKNPKGYCWHKRDKKYQARIKVNGRGIHLGLFSTIKDARNAYLNAKKQYHKILAPPQAEGKSK